MAAFQKWVHSCGDGKAVEATMRLTRVTEELHKDAGKFKTWSKILAHFGNAEEAERFRSARRAQSKGTSVCRNTGEETFLLYDEEEVSGVQRKLDEVVFEVVPPGEIDGGCSTVVPQAGAGTGAGRPAGPRWGREPQAAWEASRQP